MFARKCLSCGNTSYCAANLDDWVCPYCGENVPPAPAEEDQKPLPPNGNRLPRRAGSA